MPWANVWDAVPPHLEVNKRRLVDTDLWACARGAASSEPSRAGATRPTQASNSLSGLSRSGAVLRPPHFSLQWPEDFQVLNRVCPALRPDRALQTGAPRSLSPHPAVESQLPLRASPSAGIAAKRTHIINGVAAGTSNVSVEPNWLGLEEHHKLPRPLDIGQGPLFNSASCRLSFSTCFQGTRTSDGRILETGEPSSVVFLSVRSR